jgi:hypothetical protein
MGAAPQLPGVSAPPAPAAAAPTDATSTPDAASTAISNLETALTAAPSLKKAPGAALDVATAGGDVVSSAQAVQTAGDNQVRAAAAASTDHSAGGGLLGFLGGLGHDVAHIGGDVISDAGKALNAGLKDAQHQFRYLYDVGERHGWLAALGEGLVMAGAAAAGLAFTGGLADVAEVGALEAATTAEGVEAGAAAGGEAAAATDAGATAAEQGGGSLLRSGFKVAGKILNLGSPARALIPAEATGYAEAHAIYRDSWNRTASADYRNKAGELVNFGNVVAGLIGLKGGSQTLVSGASNAIFDIFSDPVGSVGKMTGQAKDATQGLQIAGRTFNRAFTPENLERVWADSGKTIQGNALQRGVDWLAKSNAGQIISYDRRLTPLIPDVVNEDGTVTQGLANASTPDEVMDVLRRHAATAETTASTSIPSMSMTKLKMSQLRDYMDARPVNYQHPIIGGIRHPTQLFGSLSHLTSRIPGTSFDEASRAFTSKTVNLNNLQGLDSLRDWYALGMGKDQANSITHLMVNADVATRHIIHRNASLMTLLGHAGLDYGDTDMESANWFKTATDKALDNLNKPKFREFMQRQIDSLMHPVEPDASGHYLGTLSGEPGRPLEDLETEKDHAGAVLLSQTGNIPLMDYSQLHHIAAKLAGAQTFTGTLDDFVMTHVTDPIFKRWILMSGGYAMHIAAAEMIPNTLRLGFQRMAKAGYYNALAKLGQKTENIDPAEMDAVTKVAYHILQRAPKNQAEMDKVADWIVTTSGHRVTTGLSPHGGVVDSLGDNAVGKAEGKFRGLMSRMKMKAGDNYTLYGPAESEHLHSWGQWLGLQAKDPIARSAAKGMRDAYRAGSGDMEAYDAGQRAAHETLKGLDKRTLSGYMRSTLKQRGDPANMTPLESWSHAATENVRAATHGGDDVHAPNMSLLDNVAEGRYTPEGLLHQVPVTERPLGVPGRELVPVPGGSTLARIASIGYHRALNPIVNFLSRQPLAYAEFSKRMDLYEHMEKAGVLLHEERVVRSASEATVDAIRYVHNIQDRTVLDQLLRNWVPFFFAQEQAYRRAGRLLAEDPGAFRRYELGIQSAHDLTAKQQDSSGNQYFALPGAGFLDHLSVGIFSAIGMPTASINPTGFGGTLSAANVVFPTAEGVRPDISPVVTIPSQFVYNMFEEFGQKYSALKPITGAASGALFDAIGSQAMSQSVLQQLIPNTTLYRAVETIAGNDTSFTSAMLMTMQNLAYQQNVAMEKWNEGGQRGAMPDIIPPADASPEQLQSFLSRLKNQTRIVFAMRAIIGAFSPVSADVTVNDFGLNAELQADITSQKSITMGFQKFLEDNPNATPYTVAKSTVTTGAELPDSQAAIEWVQQNQPLLNQYQYGGMWLMPTSNNDTYSAQAYYEEVASGLRVRDTPQQYLNSLYAANGDQIYYNALVQHEANLTAAGNGTAAENQEYARWDTFMQQLQKTQPIWWAQYNNGQRQSNAQRSINELTDIYNAGTAPATKTAQGQAVGALLAQYQQAEAAYMQAGSASNYSTAQSQIRDAWIAQVDQIAQQEPALAPIISSVFRDALTYTNET